MGLDLKYNEGQTPLTEQEMDGLLIKTITTHDELDEFEQMNIEKAIEWTLTKKLKKENIISEDFVKELHKKMFADVWEWAGKFRMSEKDLGIKYHLIGSSLKQLNDDCLFWINNETFEEDESVGIIDAQSVKNTLVSSENRGFDAGKRIKGLKRHIIVDTLGLILTVVIQSASV